MTDTNVIDIRQARADALVGETWTDSNGHAWTVKRQETDPATNEPRLRIVRVGTGVARWQTIEQVEGYLEAHRATPVVTETFDPTELIGRGWTNNGIHLTVTSMIESDGVVSLAVSDPEGFEMAMGVDEVRRMLGDLPEAEPEEVTVDQELATAGAIEDEQLRNRQLNPDAYVPRVLTPFSIGEGALLDDLADALRRMQAAVLKSGGKATVSVSITLEEVAPRELEIVHQVSESPPKVKQTTSFFLGGTIVPGLPKRADDSQLTIADAAEQEPAVDDQDPEVDPADHDPDEAAEGEEGGAA